MLPALVRLDFGVDPERLRISQGVLGARELLVQLVEQVGIYLLRVRVPLVRAAALPLLLAVGLSRLVDDL